MVEVDRGVIVERAAATGRAQDRTPDRAGVDSLVGDYQARPTTYTGKTLKGRYSAARSG
jgi:hypothetical protein